MRKALFQEPNSVDSIHTGKPISARKTSGQIESYLIEGLFHRTIAARATKPFGAIDQDAKSVPE